MSHGYASVYNLKLGEDSEATSSMGGVAKRFKEAIMKSGSETDHRRPYPIVT